MSPRLRRSLVSLALGIAIITGVAIAFLPDIFWESIFLLLIPLGLVVLTGIEPDRLHWLSFVLVVGIAVAASILVGTADSAFAGLWFLLLLPVAGAVPLAANATGRQRATADR